MKPIIVIDFNGALFKPRPFDEAHKRWFRLFSILLEDESLNEWTSREDYFEGVHKCMKKYLGVDNKESQTYFARQIYAMMLIAEVKEHDIIIEFAEYLRTIKDRYTLALITSAPKSAIVPMLQKVRFGDLFDIIHSSPSRYYPDKSSVFGEFITTYEKPLFYIGKGDKDLGLVKDLDIRTISVNWAGQGNFKGTYDIYSVEDLKKIL